VEEPWQWCERSGDAARNRKAILEAADELFATSDSPGDGVDGRHRRAAGVGKGTLFRASATGPT